MWSDSIGSAMMAKSPSSRKRTPTMTSSYDH